jgi:hypothetical protein
MPKIRERWQNPVVPWAAATPAQRAMLDVAWRGGQLQFQLTPSQCTTHARIRSWEKSGKGRIFCLDSSRRWGKSVLLVTIALEDALRFPGFRIVYVAPTYDQVKKITLPLFSQLLQSCPPNLLPTYVKSESTFVFGNGSKIELVGLDTRPDGARGTGVDKVLLDESGFFEQLEYLVISIIYPQMLGRMHARLVAASTPPVTPMHYWSTHMVPEAIAQDAHDRRILDDADQYSPEEIAFFYAQMPGGRDGVAARREYRAEHIADETMQIVPEFPKVEESVVCKIEPPAWRDCYVALDPGYHDMSAVLFGYWHWEKQALYVEDELAAARMNSRDLANAIKAIEQKRWAGVRRRAANGQYDTRPQPYLRVSDNDPRLLADLALDHKLSFIATQKDDLEAQINQVRVAIGTHKILIHPRCKKLQLHLRMGVWKKPGHLFAREGGDLGHFDLIAALAYLWRNVQKRRNPVPTVERMIMPDIRAPTATANDNHGRWKATQKEGAWRRRQQRLFIKTG